MIEHMIKRLTTKAELQEPDEKYLHEAFDMHTDIAECQSLYHNALFSPATRAAYRAMFQYLERNKANDMIAENITYLRATISEAESYTTLFQKKIIEAVTNNWINAESAARWHQRFHDPALLEYVRKNWFHEHFEGLWNNWKATAEKREHLLKKQDMSELTSSDVPRLAIFLSRSAFLALHWRERSALVAEVNAALRAKEQHQQYFYNACATILQGWASGSNRSLHTSKVGLWLERIFAGKYTENERRRFFASTVQSYFKTWQRLRHQFDTVHDEMRRKGIPAGFDIASLDEFLGWHVHQRETYVSEAKNRLRTPLEESTELTYLKQDIRHDLDSHDWEGAAMLLKSACRQFPEDIDLKSMERFLGAHRTDTNLSAEINEDPDQALRQIRTYVSKIDDSVKPLYIKALKEGYHVFRGLTVLMFNRVWLHRNGRYLNSTIEAEQQRSNEYKEETRIHMRQGHTNDIERNILSGDTAKEAAINDDCTNAQILYMDRGSEDAVITRIREQQSNQSSGARGFFYQTSLIPKDLPYGQHEQIVDHLHPPIKQGLRILERHGKKYE